MWEKRLKSKYYETRKVGIFQESSCNSESKVLFYYFFLQFSRMKSSRNKKQMF